MKKVLHNIVLVGMPGVGKTTIGRMLAEKFGCSFYDSDELLTEKLGATPESLIEDRGESYFRHKEALVITTLLHTDGAVISLGGGALLETQVLHALKKQTVIWLDISEPTLFKRLAEDDKHPLLRGEDKADLLKKMFEKRNPLYDEVDTYQIKVDNKTPEEIIEILTGLLRA